jgi:hypothetical protein
VFRIRELEEKNSNDVIIKAPTTTPHFEHTRSSPVSTTNGHEIPGHR